MGYSFFFLLFLSGFDPTPVYVPLGTSRCLSPGQRGPSRALPESDGGGGVVSPKGTAVSVRFRINTRDPRERRRVPSAKRPSRVYPRNSCKPGLRLVRRNLGMFIALPSNRVNFGFSRSLGSRPTRAPRWNRRQTDRPDHAWHGYNDYFRRKNLCFQRVVRSGLVGKLKNTRAAVVGRTTAGTDRQNFFRTIRPAL